MREQDFRVAPTQKAGRGVGSAEELRTVSALGTQACWDRNGGKRTKPLGTQGDKDKGRKLAKTQPTSLPFALLLRLKDRQSQDERKGQWEQQSGIDKVPQ